MIFRGRSFALSCAATSAVFSSALFTNSCRKRSFGRIGISSISPESSKPAARARSSGSSSMCRRAAWKSLAGSIALPAWWLGHDSTAQIIAVSYAQDLSDKFARDCRTIMQSSWYQSLFATRLSNERKAVGEFVTTMGGSRLATSVSGVLTGRGADVIVIDDPLKPDEALSDARRATCNNWYDTVLLSRLNDKRAGCIILIMQRLHENDLVGHVLEQEAWEVISFPAIAEEDQVCVIESPFGSPTHHRR